MGKDKNDRRSREGRHIRLYSYLTGSPAWHDLTGNAVKALIYLATWEDGRNNGELFMSERMMAEGINVSKRTAHKVFDELEEHGFIAPTSKGYFVVKRGPATCWRLTWLSWPSASKGPTNEYRGWSPAEKKSRVQNLPATGEKIAPTSTARRATGEKIAPVEPLSPETMGAKSDAHSIAIGEGVSGGEVIPFRARRACEQCGEPFNERGRVKRFCGEPCRKRAEKRRARRRETGARQAQRLETCQ